MDLTAELTKRVRQRTTWPPGVCGLEARVLEDWLGDPALFIDAMMEEDGATDDETIRRLKEFSAAVEDSARQLHPELFPYVRFTLREVPTRRARQ